MLINSNRKFASTLIALFVIGVVFIFMLKNKPNPGKRESVPETDVTSVSTKESSPSHPYVELIQINQPKPNSLVKNPIILMGKAKGAWFFEGGFPVVLVYAPSKNLSIQVRATAEGDWMSENWVEFGATLDFPPTSEDNGFIILKKDNPSGLKENDAEVWVPIKFR
jgi:hypothetical protein